MQRFTLVSFFVAGLVWGSVAAAQGPVNDAAAGVTAASIHPAILARAANGPVKAWVFLRDKGLSGAALDAAIDDLGRTYPQRATWRRGMRRTDPGLFDVRDLPVAPAYRAAIGAVSAVQQESRWLNAVSVRADLATLQRIAALECVDRIEPVRTGRGVRAVDVQPVELEPYGSRDFYGNSSGQLAQINLPALHARGYTGQGVIIGILDTGFRRDHVVFNHPTHPLNVIAEHDFINNDGNAGIDAGDPGGQHSHGTLILGCIASYLPDTLVGGAYDASVVLCKTEDITSETPVEEDNYVAGLEFIELHGGDVTTSSLGYIDWYTQGQLNGLTAVTSIAVNVASANGLHCCTAAGNEGHDDNPATSHLLAPADALRVFACGAGASGGGIAGFSSDGPSADGRIKPEILARGVNTQTISPDNTDGYAGASGTSLSTPLVGAAIACLTSAHPEWTVDQMRAAVFATASDQLANGQADPLFVRGYGFLNADLAAGRICDPDVNCDGVPDQDDVGCLILAVAGDMACFCQADPDFNGDGVPDQGDVAAVILVVAGSACP